MHTGRQNRMYRQKLKHKAPGRQARFRMADDVLILQPFELEVFQQGIPQQAELLLNYIGLENKEDIHADIEALRARQEDERAAKRVKTTQQRSAAMSANQAAGVLQGMR